MSSRTWQLPESAHAYLLSLIDEPPCGAELRAFTASMPAAGMQISPEQGAFMRLLIEMLGATRAIEIGTFTGYSALCVASALPAHGRLICCEANPDFARIARQWWEKAGLSDRIDLRLGPALQTLDDLLAEDRQRPAARSTPPNAGGFDFVFIDADKPNYGAYVERALRLLRPGGLLAVDNALWSGRVADPAADDPDTRAIRTVNKAIAHDPRVTTSLVPIGDGLLLACRRP